MKKSRRKFGKEFQLTALRRIEAGESVNEVARALEMDPSDVRRWRREWSTQGERAFCGQGHKRGQPSREAELERKIGQQAMEIDFLKRAWQRVEEQRLLRALPGGATSTNRSRRK